MTIQPRDLPRTPLDALRAQLNAFAEGDAAFPLHLSAAVQALRRQALPVLGAVLKDGSRPKGLRRAVLSLVARFDWPQWTPHLLDALKAEKELSVFDQGCEALGTLAVREAFQSLESLHALRTEGSFRLIVDRELAAYRSPHAFVHHLARVLEGSENAHLAHQGARFLAAQVDESHLSDLAEAYAGGDALSRSLLLRLLAGIPGEGATALLVDLARRISKEIQANEALAEILRGLQHLPRSSVREEMRKRVVERFQTRLPRETRNLEEADANLPENDKIALMEAFKAHAQDQSEAFLVESMGLLLDNKLARFSVYHSEQLETAERRGAALRTDLDHMAEAMVHRVSLGFVDRLKALNALKGPCDRKQGSEGLFRVLLELLPAQETVLLDQVLQGDDLRRRLQALEILGNREDNELTPFFLKAMQDSIVDVGQLAGRFVLRLPDGLPALMAQFHSEQPEQVRRAIRAFGENLTQEAAEPLLRFIQGDPKDDLLVEAVEALGDLRHAPALNTLLEPLHDGKPLALQLALVRALALLALPEASLGLLKKAPNLKHPEVLILCLEGALTAFPGFAQPLPVEHLEALLALMERCCDEREGEGQHLPAILAMRDLYVFDAKAYSHLKDRLGDFLFDMRAKENWEPANNERVAAVVKEMDRRSENLTLLARKEKEIQALAQQLEQSDPVRLEDLQALKNALADPDLILRGEVAVRLAQLVEKVLAKKPSDWRQSACLCEIGGFLGQKTLVEPIRAVHAHSKSLGLRSASRKALKDLGLSEAEIDRKLPVERILLLEPSTFFRKRLVAALGGRWQVQEAADRAQAEALLQTQPVDLLLSETRDGQGDLRAWIESQWGQGRCRTVILSAAQREAIAEAPWLEAALFKPYPMEQLLQILAPDA
ncbi:MAG: hypothetical protein LWX11_01635 [Firmicutes bacterium]|nr:hypothetical protein [Bacillota bacterium]